MESDKEREILRVMRQVLGSVIRDITPEPGMRHPLSSKTIEDVRMCLGLITSRERELAEAAGVQMERPQFADEVSTTKVVPISRIGRVNNDEPSGE